MNAESIASLRAEIAATEQHLQSLQARLQQVEHAQLVDEAILGGFPAEWINEALSVLGQSSDDVRSAATPGSVDSSAARPPTAPAQSRWPLEDEEYRRYGRQMILKEVGLHGQLRLKRAKVLLVGVGGLGCPAAAYLAGAGVGTIGLMDGDTVEVSNLHRQIAHSTEKVGMSKVESARQYLKALNPNVNYVSHPSHLMPETATATFSNYDLVLDCTDHPTSRYLISDACVLTNKPLVSASALKTEGQLIVLNNPPRPPGNLTGGPCYRCIFPKPPPAESIQSCGEGGILGPVVGVMGVLQALEAIKLLVAEPVVDRRDEFDWMMDLPDEQEEPVRPSMLMFSAYSSPPFRSVRMRGRRVNCAVCSAQASIKAQGLESGSLDYVAFCGVTNSVDILPAEARVTAAEFSRMPRDGRNVLIDVRDETQYAICALRGSINVPWTGDGGSWVEEAVKRGALAMHAMEDGKERFVVCRLGNDSQLAVRAAMERGAGRVRDVRGGFRAWRDEVDGGWPQY